MTPDNRISPLSCEIEVTTKLKNVISTTSLEEINTVDTICPKNHVQEDEQNESSEENRGREGSIQNAPDSCTKGIQPIIELHPNNSATTTDNSCIAKVSVVDDDYQADFSECVDEIICANLERDPTTELELKLQNERKVDSLRISAFIPSELNLMDSTPVDVLYSEQDSHTDENNYNARQLYKEGSEMEKSKLIEDDREIVGTEDGSKIVDTKPKGEEMNEEEETEKLLSEEENKIIDSEESGQKMSVSVKRKSMHSFIPRKQLVQLYTTAENEAAQSIESNDVSAVKPSLSLSKSLREISINELNVTARRGSSSSFIPIPNQQNRTSVPMIDVHTNENIVSHNSCSPSSSSDSLLKTPPHTLPMSQSASSSSRKNASNTVYEKKKVSSVIKQSASGNGSSNGKSSGICITQTSKIPVFTTLASHHLQNDMQKSSLSTPNVNITSRLPVKRNPAAV